MTGCSGYPTDLLGSCPVCGRLLVWDVPNNPDRYEPLFPTLIFDTTCPNSDCKANLEISVLPIGRLTAKRSSHD